jgi:hypothetical protein
MIPNAHLASIIVASFSDDPLTHISDPETSRIDLDTHANMLVAGKHTYMLNPT